MAIAGHRCAAIASRLRNERSRVNVRHKPDAAPTYFIIPTKTKIVLKEGPIDQLLFCACENCQIYSGLSADERRNQYPHELDNKYFTVFALLITENCAGLIWDFQRKGITLDKQIYKEQLDFLLLLLKGRSITKDEIIDVTSRIIKNQFCFFAPLFETGKIDKEYGSEEALPIDEEKDPVGEGGFGEVFAFKIFEEYKGAGYKALEVTQFKRPERL